ncbi:Carbamoyl-phosphate synthase small chain [invertebrate metagenome]|uniref:carbamoyl-phosphate synthase (glutamine-hydrolyzing) n=1 Tax=invertebrate metagenome TaxID=1711999 RepID=A0A484H7W4_9ZZZZ
MCMLPVSSDMLLRTPGTNACLMLADGTVFWGYGVGATGTATGEVVFNTAMTGYQEVLTDPSYAGQIITFTFPYIGNTGTNDEDFESAIPAARGCILRAAITQPSNWRALASLDSWLNAQQLVGLCGLDTRCLTRRIRDLGAPNGVIAHAATEENRLDLAALHAQAQAWPGSIGLDLAKSVTCRQPYQWAETTWQQGQGYGCLSNPCWHVVVMDYGAKRNILRSLAAVGCRVTVVPATATIREILQHQPDGVLLSNGPGDPAATGTYAVPVIQAILETGLPLFGICLGHQMLALALGARTYKMAVGHRGANQPVKDLATGRVEITSQNHGFCVDRLTLPTNVVETHTSLFDGSLEGLQIRERPIFSVQYHPEASPGPRDSAYLFQRFADAMAAHRVQNKMQL